MWKLRTRSIFIMGIALFLSLSISGCTNNKDVDNIKGITATVNGRGITEKQYEKDLQIREGIHRRQSSSPKVLSSKTEVNNLKEDVLDELILETLILQDAEKRNISVTDRVIDEEINKNIEKIGGKDQLLKELEDNGVSFNYYRDMLKKQNIIKKYKENVKEEINISERKVKKYFKENKEDLIMLRGRHILVDNKEQGRLILEELKNGIEFSLLAIEESLDTKTAVEGGDLGYFSRGDLGIKELEDAAFELEIGEVSNLIKTEVGYHIIYLEDKKDTFKDLKENIVMILKEKEYTKYIQKLQDKADISVFLDIENGN